MSKRGSVKVRDYPDLVAEWDWERNGNLTPDQVPAGSNKKAAWKCSKEHRWIAVVQSRTRGARCPYCTGRLTPPERSIAKLMPALAAEWHPTKNLPLTAEQVSSGSDRKVWWMCNRGHEYQTVVHSRAGQGTGCPYCAGRRATPETSLAGKRPEVAQLLHPVMNHTLTATQILPWSGKKVWWQCGSDPGHEWETSPNEWQGCPSCAADQLRASSLAALRPDIAKDWHPTKNLPLTPDAISVGSGKKVWWKCSRGPDHEWRTSVNLRAGSGTGCPCCANRQISVTNSLASVFPEIAAEWDHEANGKLTANGVVYGTTKSVAWKCPKGPDHRWRATITNRTLLGSGCPFCAGLRVSEGNSLKDRFPEIAEEWDYDKNGDRTPAEVAPFSNKKYAWKCAVATDHQWIAKVANRTILGRGCPFCAGQESSSTNSVAKMPELAAQWDYEKNGNLTPADVTTGSGRKIWWVHQLISDDSGVSETHSWRAAVYSRASGNGCPDCQLRPQSWMQLQLAFELSAFFNFDPRQQFRLFLGGKSREIDILITEEQIRGSKKGTPLSIKGLAIEYDGSFWHKGKEAEDREKTRLMSQDGWTVIRVRREPLQSIGEDDIELPIGASMLVCSQLVLKRVESVCGIAIAGLQDYLKSTEPIRSSEALRYRDRVLGLKTQQDRLIVARH